MTLKIESGKFYRNSAGERIGPMRRAKNAPREFPYYAGDLLGRYAKDGACRFTNLPLVAEWTEADTIKAVVSERIALRSEAQKAEMDKLLFADGPDVKAEILEEAGNIVNGARRKAYGTPENNFERIARFWQAYFDNTDRDVVITAADVSPMMRLMKEARLCETPDHKDSFVDIIGYALTGAEVNKVKPKNSD